METTAKKKEIALELLGVYKDFSGTEVIRGVDFRVAEREKHAVIGPNGAGKTTLFNLITGNTIPGRGKILFYGKEIQGIAPHRINRLGISRSFQITNIFRRLSVYENVRAAVLSRHGIRMNFYRNVDRLQGIREETMRLLSEIGLAERGSTAAGELAYGEQRALEIGLAIASDASVILLDEPTAGMSIEETRETIDLIRRVCGGRTLLIIEHDMDVVFHLADAITVIQYGKVIASGSPESVRTDSRVRDAYLGDRF